MTLINVNLTQAFDAFVSSVAKHCTDPIVLDEIYQEKLGRLDQYMGVLTKLASAGMEEQLSPLLSTLLEEWATKEAVELLLHYQGCTFNPADQGLRQSFWSKLGRQHQALSSELLLHLQQAEERRAHAQEERSQNWQSIATRTFENQQSQQQRWMQCQQQLNQQWANTALTGVQQAQLGMQQWYGFAASTQANVATMLAGTEQRQVAVAEQTIQKASRKKWTTRLTIIGLVLLGIIALFGCSLFAMMHLY